MQTAVKTSIALATVTFGMLLAVACEAGKTKDAQASKSEEATTEPARSSCNAITTTNTCTDYVANGRMDLEKALCDGAKGKFANEACPKSGEVASCAVGRPASEVKHYYAGVALDAARASCQTDSVFAAK